MSKPMLTISEIMSIAKLKEDGWFLYPTGEGVYNVLRTWYNNHISHIDIYQKDGTGDPIEKWLVLQRKNLIDARIVTNDASENFVLGVYENIIKVMDREKMHVYVEMFQGCIEEVKIFDSDEKYQEAHNKWKDEMEIKDEPEEEAYGSEEGTCVLGFETHIE